MEKHFELTTEVKENEYGVVLHRIRATRDSLYAKEGQLGGWVESEKNLYDNAWVADNAEVFGKAIVTGNAIVAGDACVYDNTQVYDNARVYGNAKVFNYAYIFDSARVHGNAKVFNYACVCGNAQVYDDVKIYDNVKIYGNAIVIDDARVFGNARVHGNAAVCGNALIQSNKDYIVFKNYWSSGRYFTWTRSNNMWIVGCFYGSGNELIEKAYRDSEESGREYERVVKYVESILADEDNNKTR